MDDLKRLMSGYRADPVGLLSHLIVVAALNDDVVMEKALHASAKVCEVLVPELTKDKKIEIQIFTNPAT